MVNQIGTALDFLIVLIAPVLLYIRVSAIMESGVSAMLLLSVVIILAALIFALTNLYRTFLSARSNGPKK